MLHRRAEAREHTRCAVGLSATIPEAQITPSQTPAPLEVSCWVLRGTCFLPPPDDAIMCPEVFTLEGGGWGPDPSFVQPGQLVEEGCKGSSEPHSGAVRPGIGYS